MSLKRSIGFRHETFLDVVVDFSSPIFLLKQVENLIQWRSRRRMSLVKVRLQHSSCLCVRRDSELFNHMAA